MRRESPKPTVAKQGDSNQASVVPALQQMKLGENESAEDNAKQQQPKTQPGPQVQQKPQVEAPEFELKVESRNENMGRFADEPEYRMDHARRGTAVIINNRRFDAKLDMPTREGSDKDAASLEFSFRKLGFDVRLAHNCTATFMRQELFKAARADHSTADCFVCVILSHGDEGTVYAVDKAVELDALIQPFKQNRTLAGKPKLFFVQACRGSSFMEGIDSNPYEINYVNKIPMEADFLVAYSTIAGFYSWRNSQNGSWFVQSLCHVLNERGRTDELLQLLTAVNRRVAYHFESNTADPDMSGKRQIPCIVSMLTKELYFRPKSR